MGKLKGSFFYFSFLILTCCSCAPQVPYRPLTPPFKISPRSPYTPVNNKPPLKLIEKEDKPLIVIDPGHGGEDFGTQSNSKPKYLEKYLNLATAQILGRFLNQMGYATVFTRTADVFIPLDKRAEFANNKKPYLFVSVHFNSAPSPAAEGIEVFYYRSEEDKERSAQSKVLAKTILDNITLSSQAKSRGVKHGNFAVIRLTNMPAVLVEGGFLTNENEMQRIKDPAYLKKLAWGIALGIQTYIKK